VNEREQLVDAVGPVFDDDRAFWRGRRRLSLRDPATVSV
jgi:hypothetical protein